MPSKAVTHIQKMAPGPPSVSATAIPMILPVPTRVGTGNIIGIAVALTLGGPGAIFWMWVTALLGMSIAFVESTLAQIFKVPHKDRTFRGGPAYYIRMGLNS